MRQAAAFCVLVALLATPALHAAPRAQLASKSLAEAPVKAFKATKLDKKSLEAMPDNQVTIAKSIAIDLADGNWAQLNDTTWRWQLRVRAQGARSLGLQFSELLLPQGARMMLLDATGNGYGAFTASEARPGKRFHSPLLNGSELIIRIDVPSAQRDFLRLRADRLDYGMRRFSPDLFTREQKSGSCNIDVACPEGDGWREQIASVAHYSFSGSGGTFVCSGQLLNDATGDNPALFLTAAHCVSSQAGADSMRFYWEFESPSCRAPGSAASGSSLSRSEYSRETTEGAMLLAVDDGPSGNVTASDHALFELTETPQEVEVFFSGWDRSGDTPNAATTIHHPAGDAKRISFEDDPLSVTPYLDQSGSEADHWKVSAWDSGTTEGGSSGSGLWDPERRLVGVLSGGYASCASIGTPDPSDDADWYGRLSEAWVGDGTVAGSLSTHLDPDGSGTTSVDGRFACSAPELSASASANPATIGTSVSFTLDAGASATESGWDLDGDGTIDVNQSSITRRFYDTRPRVLTAIARSANGCQRNVPITLSLAGPSLSVTNPTSPSEIAGNGDGNFDPGEIIEISLAVTNTGPVALEKGLLQLKTSSDDSVQRLTGPACDGNWLSKPAGAQDLSFAAAGLSDANDEGGTEAIPLPANFQLLDQSPTNMKMSSNGYLYSGNDDPGDYAPDCGAAPTAQLRLLPLHSDLITASAWTHFFDNCPRQAMGPGADGSCRVFAWQDAVLYDDQEGDAVEFQAVVHGGNSELAYFYRAASGDGFGSELIGLRGESVDSVNVLGCSPQTPNLPEKQCLIPGGLAGDASPSGLARSVVNLGDLATGEGKQYTVQLRIPEFQACGTDIQVTAGSWAGANASGVNPINVASLSIGDSNGSCEVYSETSLERDTVSALGGMWWNPARDGNGFDVYPIGDDAVAMIWYTARPDGTPIWYLAQGPRDGNRVTAELLRYTWQNGGATTDVVGMVELTFASLDTALIDWQIGAFKGQERIQLFEFAGPIVSPGVSGNWYDPNESGWGVTINEQMGASAVEARIAYVFDGQGRPVWTLGVGTDQEPFSVDSYSTACPWCGWFEYDLSNAGTVGANLDNDGAGNMTINIDLPGPLNGVWVRDTAVERIISPATN